LFSNKPAYAFDNYQLKKEKKYNYEGCLECGSCKFACPKGAVDFSYPRGGYGVYYKYG
jgi:ferredoxin like protein